MTRLASIARGSRLMVDVDADVAQAPFACGGKTLRYVDSVPSTAVRLSTAACAVPTVGMSGCTPLPPSGIPETFTFTTAPGPRRWSLEPLPLQLLSGCSALVSHTRSGAMEWNCPGGSPGVSGAK